MTQTLRERQHQMVRDEILDAAQALVAQKGYGAVSMDELAAHAGISKPTLYKYFPTKEELVIASVLREMKQLLAMFEAPFEGETPLGRLELLLRAMIERQVDADNLALRPWSPDLGQKLHANDEARSYMCRMHNATARLIQAGIAAGEIDPNLEPETMVRAFYALAMSLKFAHYHTPSPVDPQKVITSLVTMFRRAVQSVG
jgi:AcrR family transcriptional regulator